MFAYDNFEDRTDDILWIYWIFGLSEILYLLRLCYTIEICGN